MSPEWDRFVTNHEQLYAYLKQHEKHAAQDRLIIERITPAMNDQLAFVSMVQPHDPIATELKIYKEQVTIYEQCAKFELTGCEQRMDDQMRMLIQNHNKTEENLKKEL
ncbi:hypothetical protein Tco_0457289, partial [Tanacetum coccineum]